MCSLGRNLLAFALLHSVLQGQICLLLQVFLAHVDEYGEASLDFNNDDNKGLMKTFADAAKKGYLRTPAVIGQSYSSNYFKVNNTLFSSG